MLKDRAFAFSLTELLIVMMIVAILSGAILMAMGTAAERAEATKVVNDLRNVKEAAIMYYFDEKQWPATGDYPSSGPAAIVTSIDKFLADPIFRKPDNKRYSSLIIASYTDPSGSQRELVGLGFSAAADASVSGGVRDRLAGEAPNANLLNRDGTEYKSPGNEIFMHLY
jgi:prepilin-type N-terminal cleavage/methylation domain-containing protein